MVFSVSLPQKTPFDMKKRIFSALFATLVAALSAWAGWNIQSHRKYYIHCNAATGYLALGAQQNTSFDLFYQPRTAIPSADGYWHLVESGTGYAIQNAKTGQYLSWSSDYDTKRNLTLAASVEGDDQRWRLVAASGHVKILNLAHPTYCLNMRTNNYRVACYQSNASNQNEQFRIYADDGQEITYTSDSGDSSPFSPGKRYLLHNANGYGYCVYTPLFSDKAPALAGYTHGANGCANPLYKVAADVTHANSQWTLVPDGQGNHSLYSLGRAMYISNEQTGGRDFLFTDTPSPFTLTAVGQGTYALRLASLAADEKAYLCAASQNETTPIAYWQISDAGSQWLLEEAVTTTFATTGGGGSSTTGSDTTAEWDGQGAATHRFPDWTSNNTGAHNTSSNYFVRITQAGSYAVSFTWEVSCENQYDYFTASIGDKQVIVEPQSGTQNGTYNRQLTLEAGATLRFTYTKDAITSAGSDQAQVRDLILTRIVPVESLALTPASPQRLSLGDQLQLTATASPATATDTGVTWSSSAPHVAAVSSTGQVTALATGQTTITATARDGSGVQATLTLEVDDPFVAHDGRYLYLRHGNGRMTLLPLSHVQSHQYSGSRFTATLTDGQPLSLTSIIEVTTDIPTDRPGFTSYKFNNKYNHQLFTDAEASTPSADQFALEVGCIGKWLTASFQTTSETTKVWVKGIRQRSRQSRLNFASPVTYLLTDDNWQVLRLRQETDGTFTRTHLPYSRAVTVEVTFRSDNPTSQYGVPRIDIVLLDANGQPGTAWNQFAWIGMNGKETYQDATITIDGAGVYPSMETTPIQIRGRGNTSWSSNYMSKNPYRFKFSEGQKPLGMTKGKHWVLLSNKQSGSMTTNAIGHTVAALVGGAGYCHIVPVELYVNGSYRGSYNLTERIGFSNNSIDLEDESLAAMVELDTYTSGEIYDSNNAYNLPVQLKEPDFEEAGTQFGMEDVFSDFRALTEAVAEGDGSFLNRVDADYLTRFFMVNEFIVNRELMHPKSVFAYSTNVTDAPNAEGKDETPWIFGPAWDFDWAFGYEQNRTYFVTNAEGDYFGELIDGGTSLGRAKLFWNGMRYGAEEMNRRYYALWHRFVNGGALAELLDYCDTYYNFAARSFAHNRNTQASEKDYINYETLTARSKRWLSTRAAYVLNALQPYDLPAEPEDEDIVTPDRMGDVNDDGMLTAADVVSVLNSMVNLPNETFYASRADLNSDGEVSIADVVLLCNRIMAQPAGVKRSLLVPASRAALRLANVVCPAQSEVMMPLTLNVQEGAYSALQMDVFLPEGVELGGLKLPAPLAGFAARTQLIADGHYRVLLYADGSLTLAEGQTTLHLRLHTGGQQEGILLVKDATLSTAQGEAERLSSQSAALRLTDHTQTAITATEAGSQIQSGTLYDLSGRAVQPTLMQRGVYILNGKKIIQ